MYQIWMNLWRFQASNGKFKIWNIFTWPYKEICWQKLYLCSPGPLHVYSGAVKKDRLTIKDYYMCTSQLWYANLVGVSSLTYEHLQPK